MILRAGHEMTLPIPQTTAEFTPAWLDAALMEAGVAAPPVRALAFERLPSITSDVARVRIEYAAEMHGAPSSLIWKRSAGDRDRRLAFGASYAQEVMFYRELAPELPIRLPGCLCADVDPVSGAHVLLLEDLVDWRATSAGSAVTRDEAQRFVRAVAGLHATRWGEAPAPRATDLARWAAFNRGQLASGMEYLDAFLDEETRPLVARFDARVDEVLAGLFAAPQTLTHGDAHPGNALFEPRRGGDVALVDWQGWGSGIGCSEVARFLVLGLAPADRRAAERELVDEYVAALSAGGVTYAPEDAWRHYCLGVAWQWGWAVNFSRHRANWSDETHALMRDLVPRAVEALRDAARTGLLD